MFIKTVFIVISVSFCGISAFFLKKNVNKICLDIVRVYIEGIQLLVRQFVFLLFITFLFNVSLLSAAREIST